MCGVCGIVDLSNSPPIKADELHDMCKTIEHRGPDGSRTIIRDSVGFGHTRLSVIDKETGWQPIENEDGYYVRADVKNINNSEGLSEGDPRAGETVAGQNTTFNARVVLPRTFTVSVGKRF